MIKLQIMEIVCAENMDDVRPFRVAATWCATISVQIVIKLSGVPVSVSAVHI